MTASGSWVTPNMLYMIRVSPAVLAWLTVVLTCVLHLLLCWRGLQELREALLQRINDNINNKVQPVGLRCRWLLPLPESACACV